MKKKKTARKIDNNTGSFFKDFKDYIVNDSTDLVGAISTGSIMFDKATGIGGVPRGRIIELCGVESSSKTTFSLHVIANAQKLGLPCVFIDNERTLDLEYAKVIGVDIKKLCVLHGDSLEQTLQMIYQINTSKEMENGVIVWDSIGLTPLHGELNEQIDKSHMGDRAQLIWTHVRRIPSIASKRNITNLYINQTTQSFNIWEPFNTPGGSGLKVACSMRAQLTAGKKQALKINGVEQDPWGIIINFIVKKNKLSMPHKKAQTILRFGVGYDEIYDVIELVEYKKVFQKNGSWFVYNDKNIANGKESLRKMFLEDEKFYNEIKKKVI